MRRLHAPGRARGVSLVEALIALGVMAFGIMGLVGIQANLRSNSDISKQRAEAARYAQQLIEERRNFIALQSTGDPNVFGYADIVTSTLPDVTGSNATYTREVSVSNSTAARVKLIRSTVSWTDRAGQPQSVQLYASIGGASPELAATVGIPALSTTARLPQGRSLQIPRDAVDIGDGTSRFTPPGGGSLRWYFNNQSGALTRICVDPDNCTDVNARLLSGFVRFALGSTQPTPADAENPTDDGPDGVEVIVDQDAPTDTINLCFEDDQGPFVAYYCAVHVTTEVPRWTGQSLLAGLPLATSIASTSASQYRVCRYTTLRSQAVVPTEITNAEHPYRYVDVDIGLQYQNFLVIRAGDGSVAFDCPADDTATPLVNGNTWHHQPAS